MRIAIGDVHGRDFWKQALEGDFTEAYFVGDYFDSFDLPYAKQAETFFEITKLARSDKRVKLLLGNHDYHYLRGVNEHYSGFQNIRYHDIQEMLEASIDLIDVCVVSGNYLISHAGFTKTYMEKIGITDPLEINQLFREKRSILEFDGYDQYGDDPVNGPIWVRPRSLLADKLDGFKQIVGHTRMEKIQTVEDVSFIDTEGRDTFSF